MPRIPVYDRTPTITPTPQGRIPRVGGQAEIDSITNTQRLIQNASNVIATASDIEAKREQADANDYAFKQANDLYTKASKFESQSKAQGIDGHEERVSKFMEEERQAAVRNAPSDLAAQEYDKQATHYFAKTIVDAGNWEKVEKAKYNAFKYDKEQEDTSNAWISNPAKGILDYELKAGQTEQAMRKDVGTAFFGAELDQKIKEMRNGYLTGIYQGLDAKEDYAKMKSLLMGDSRLSTDLDPKLKATFLKRAEAGLEQVGKREASNLRDQAHDYIAFSVQQGETNPAKYNAISAKIANNPYIEKDDKAKLLDNLKTSQIVATDIKAAKAMPESEWANLVSLQKDNKEWNFASRQRIKNETMQALNEIKQQRSKDPVQATVEAFPYLKTLQEKSLSSPEAMDEFNRAVVSQQKTWGIPLDQMRLTSKSQSAFIGEQINSAIQADSPGALQAVTDEIQKKYGSNAHQVYNELVKDKHVDNGFFLVGQVSTDVAKKSLVYNLKKAKQINDGFTTQFGSENSTQLKNLVQAKTTDQAYAFNSAGGGDLSLGKAYQDQILLEAKKIRLNRSDISDVDAVNLAQKNIIEDNFDLVRGGRSFVAKSKKLSNVPANNVSRFMEVTTNPTGIAQLNPDIPDVAKTLYGDRAKEMYYNHLAATSRWVMNSDQKSMTMVYDGLDGNVGVVFTTNNGVRRPIQVTLESLKELNSDIQNQINQDIMDKYILPKTNKGKVK